VGAAARAGSSGIGRERAADDGSADLGGGVRATVSTIITCFNHAKFLGEAIQSALSQTRRPDELIVVDDGSTDDTASVSAKFPSVSYVFQNNRGLAAARNTGLLRASCTYILFLDADDILRPTAVENCLAALESNPQCAFVYGGFWIVDSERRFISENIPEPRADQFAALLSNNHVRMHGTVMYRRGILFMTGGFDESLPCCEDYDTYLRLARSFPITPYTSIAAEYRSHGENMTKNAALMLKTVKGVLARHASAAQRSREWRVAYLEGQRLWSSCYGPGVLGQIVEEFRDRRRLSVLVSLVAIGLRYDPDFGSRLGQRLISKAKAVCGLRRKKDMDTQTADADR
jgi:glycosyltransferase involved in cell wall biosynthesis